MKTLAIAAGLFCFGVHLCSAQEATKPQQEPRVFERKITKTVGAQYLLFLPRDYNTNGSKLWPLILFLHGAGERGANIHLVTVHGPPKIVKDKPDFPFILVSPQCPDGQTWSNDVLLGLLDEVTEKFKVDSKRIYLTGLSMGGYGTWNLAVAHPERFAAVAPICGGGDPIPVRLASREGASGLRTLPIWAFHGAKDPVVKPSESERMIDAFRNIGNEAKLTIYEDATHDSWTRTYENPELFDWFLRHQR